METERQIERATKSEREGVKEGEIASKRRSVG